MFINPVGSGRVIPKIIVYIRKKKLKTRKIRIVDFSEAFNTVDHDILFLIFSNLRFASDQASFSFFNIITNHSN